MNVFSEQGRSIEMGIQGGFHDVKKKQNKLIDKLIGLNLIIKTYLASKFR
jgi:hypothetical protein